jgi:DNA repair exonuclease SbcCD nuclease subunit
MPVAEFLLVGDTHLGRLETTFAKYDWLKWSLAPLYEVEQYAIKHGIKNIIQTGDVFDVAAPGQHLLRALARFLFRSKLRWHFGIGNHDISHRGRHSLVLLDYLSRQLRANDWRFYPKATSVSIARVPVIFLPYPITRHKILRRRPALIIAHADRAGMRYDNGRQIRGNKFRLRGHFWAIGHLHQFQTDTNVLFPGAVSQLRFGDGENKYFCHLRVQHDRTKISVKYKRIRFTPAFRLRDFQVDSARSLSRLDFSDPTIFYRLVIQQNVAVPEQYFNHPQVISHKFYGDERDLRAIKTEMFNLKTAKLTVTDRLVALKIWLQRNTKLPKRRIAFAVKYARAKERALLGGINERGRISRR